MSILWAGECVFDGRRSILLGDPEVVEFLARRRADWTVATSGTLVLWVKPKVDVMVSKFHFDIMQKEGGQELPMFAGRFVADGGVVVVIPSPVDGSPPLTDNRSSRSPHGI